MTELNVEGLSDFAKVIYEEEECTQFYPQVKPQVMNVRSNSSNNDNDEYMVQSPFRSSDPTMINRHRIIGFEKTGELLKRMKRQLSTQALQKVSDKSAYKINDKMSTQHSFCNDVARLNWQKSEKDEMAEAIMDQYEKQILRLKAQLDDIKEEKKTLKDTLEKQRRFYMTEMYSKELIMEEHEFQIQRLKGQIQKHINLQYQFQEKIRLLELENSEYKYQLEGWLSSSRENSQQMEPIEEENEDFCSNNGRRESKLFMSVDNGFARGHQMRHEDPFEVMRLAHQREIVRYEREIKSLKDFYQTKLRAMRKSCTPQKQNPPRNSITIMDEYICPDNISTQSLQPQNRQNLKSILRQQFNGRSAKKVDDCQSFATGKYFNYPKNSKKNLYGEDLFMRQVQVEQVEQLEIRISEKKLQTEECETQRNTRWYNLKSFGSKDFVKGFTVGSLASGVIAFVAFKTLLKN